MEIVKLKIWETPTLKDLNVQKTESGIYTAYVEIGTYAGPSGAGGPTPAP